MKRHLGLSLFLTICLGTAGAFAQESMNGYFDGLPEGQNAGGGVMTFKGWAVADSGIRQVILQVDGVEIGNAIYGRYRPRVAERFPGYPDSNAAGFFYNLDSTQFPNGLYHINAKAISNNGNIQVLGPTYEVEIRNNLSLLLPFGRIQSLQRNTDVFGTCFNRTGPIRLTVIEGWALDLGLHPSDTGIGWLELVLNDATELANTRRDCTYVPGAGGFTSCYGLYHPANQRNYPFAVDAPASGFRFVMDVGALIDFGYSQGKHELTIRASDKAEQFTNIDTMPVFFNCIENINEGSYGKIESPFDGRVYSDTVNFKGWSVDWEGVNLVNVWIDGTFVGHADYGVDDGVFETRPSVFSQYLNFPDVAAPVWILRDFDTNNLSDGMHEIQVFVVDKEGDRTFIGERTFFVDNRQPPNP